MIRKSLTILHWLVVSMLMLSALATITITIAPPTPRPRYYPYTWSLQDTEFKYLRVYWADKYAGVKFWRAPPCLRCDGSIIVHHRGCELLKLRADYLPFEMDEFRFAGVEWSAKGRVVREYRLNVSHWTLAAILGAYPLLFIGRRVLRRKRNKPGHCVQCGYNLTGLPSPRCPECGTENAGSRG